MRITIIGSVVWLAVTWPVLLMAQIPAESPTPSPAESDPGSRPLLILRDSGNASDSTAAQPTGSSTAVEVVAPITAVTGKPANSANPPLILRDAGTAARAPRELESVIMDLREQMRAVAASSVTAAEKQASVEKIVSKHPLIFRQQSTEMPAARPLSVEGLIDLLEQRLYEIAVDVAPDEETRRNVQKSAPTGEELEPLRPILIAPKVHRSKIVVTSEAEAQAGYTPWGKTAVTAQEEPQAGATLDIEEVPEEDVEEELVKVEFLADEQVTAEMHDDTTVLRSVEDDEGDLVLFDALHLWVGGSVQLDVYSMEGLFQHDEGGDRDRDVRIRRAEGILRATLLDLGEIKLQYDFDATIFRDLYWRWVSDTTSQTLTVGNQKETLGLDFLMGNKFGTAMERSAPASAFGAYRSKGIRFNRWFDLSPDQTQLDVWGENRTYVTSTIGIYTEDIESSHDTDWAVTGRITGGAQRQDNSSIHLGVSGSYREGDFDRIAPRPELQEASRILLAEFEANAQAVVGLEAMYSRGSLHSQVEFYYSDYRGGKVDAEGFGGYAQLGWLFGGHQRSYRARWGLWAPVNPQSQHVFEVFSRLSYTRGEDDNHTWNDLRLLTVGGSWYY
ncbi:MAG: porin, partial [Gammaproteobacteria bacterium]|nr:porin [Gammaproteobacteria bacterium]